MAPIGSLFRLSVGALVAGATITATPVHAQGLFESLFGGMRRSSPPAESSIRSYADPSTEPGRDAPQIARGGGGTAYCVRTCDGHYFPVHAQGGASAAQMCKSFCPASETRVYSGGSIDHAAASDGSRYADLPNAYTYRQKLVGGCSCNGRSAFGLARIDAASDPTLRKGDVVATKQGLTVYNAGKESGGEFTPVENSNTIPKAMREKLSNTQILLPAHSPPRATPVSIAD